MPSVVDFLINNFKEFNDADAIIFKGETFSYKDLLTLIKTSTDFLDNYSVPNSSVVMLEASCSARSISMMIALLQRDCIIVPSLLSNPLKFQMSDIAQVQYIVSINSNDWRYDCALKDNQKIISPLLIQLHDNNRPGIVLFSSGSTGIPKASVHDANCFLKKYQVRRYSKRTLSILLFDHIGGLDNVFYTLSNGGCLIICDPLTAEESCKLTDKHRVQVFPASPSFLNLLLLGEEYKGHDLTCVETVTYGAEVMPQFILNKLSEIFPNARFLQKYGLTELGTLRSHSKSSDSLWVKIGGDGFETRVVDGMLQIKAESAMLSYLNAPSPFTDDGWFITGDEVEIDGDYYLIKGRRSEIINVGGQKVYPAEVESVILQMDGVLDAVITGEKNPILGKIVTAKVHLADEEETVKDFTRRMKIYCKDKLQPFQVPQKVTIEQKDFTNSRFKKIRK